MKKKVTRRSGPTTADDLAALDAIANRAPKAWRSQKALTTAGFVRVRGGLREAAVASRLCRLSRQMAALRREAGLTQAQVARRMGTTASAVSRMESDHPGNLTLATLERFAEAIGADLLLSLQPARNP